MNSTRVSLLARNPAAMSRLLVVRGGAPGRMTRQTWASSTCPTFVVRRKKKVAGPEFESWRGHACTRTGFHLRGRKPFRCGCCRKTRTANRLWGIALASARHKHAALASSPVVPKDAQGRGNGSRWRRRAAVGAENAARNATWDRGESTLYSFRPDQRQVAGSTSVLRPPNNKANGQVTQCR